MNIKEFFARAKNDQINELRKCKTEDEVLDFAKKNNVSVYGDQVEKVLSVIEREISDDELDKVPGGVGAVLEKENIGLGYCEKHGGYLHCPPTAFDCKMWDNGLPIFGEPGEDNGLSRRICQTCIYFSN